MSAVLKVPESKVLSALSGLSLSELKELVLSKLPLETYRINQIHSWIYAKSSSVIDRWSDLASDKRSMLSENFRIALLDLKNHQISKQDGTQKFLFTLPDGQYIESVLMKLKGSKSYSACISSQVGCAVGCPFCATGKLGLKRNLTPAEIVDQVMSMQRITGERIHNLVFMGQGEPLHNLPNLLKAISILRDSVGIGVRHITISTSGLVPQIRELGATKLQINLAISLHSASQELREKLVPIARRWNLLELRKALTDYFGLTGRRITFEYTLLKDINDTAQEARALADFVRDLPFPCLINLIPFNDNPSSQFRRPERRQIEIFREIVEHSGRKVTVRQTLGRDIAAACGQLANQEQTIPKDLQFN
ncbi:MAG: 23S rRNA (adenine(2503)-C(2))-methyltransferase RlmN [Candidatus Caenarcaniphilales bacterium]|nr:23S rRNA (adenine(2503)-C(2))-methyltransferase RlmN [Candidatus Caenarcaniphilales bacterium]